MNGNNNNNNNEIICFCFLGWLLICLKKSCLLVVFFISFNLNNIKVSPVIFVVWIISLIQKISNIKVNFITHTSAFSFNLWFSQVNDTCKGQRSDYTLNRWWSHDAQLVCPCVFPWQQPGPTPLSSRSAADHLTISKWDGREEWGELWWIWAKQEAFLSLFTVYTLELLRSASPSGYKLHTCN